MKVLSIIPARGGSKSIPKKNIVDLLGKPLISWTIEASLNSKYISKTIVSSDDNEILEISKKYGATPYKRDVNLSGDYIKTEPVLLDVINNLEEEYDLLVLLQATSPLRNFEHIDAAFEKFFESNNEALISVYEPDHSPFKAFTVENNGVLKGIVNDEYPFSPRQLLPKAYYPNGAIYIININTFLKNKSLFISKNTGFYIMDKNSSKDIDSYIELQEVEEILMSRSF